MSGKDIRWHQRFRNFSKTFAQLEKFIAQGERLNELEEQGLIQSFEYNFELAWNVLKDYYEHQGETAIQGSRDAFRLAFSRELIGDGESWMNMIQSRQQTSHTYNEATADEVVKAIRAEYYQLFKSLHKALNEELNEEE